MRVLVAVSLMLVSAIGCAGGSGAAAAAPTPVSDAGGIPDVSLRLPQEIGDFRFVGRQEYEDASHGAMFRFRTADSLVADVFLYPGPDLNTDCPLDCARRLLKSEHEGFRNALGELKRLGRHEAYKHLSNAAIPRPADASWAIGHRVHGQVSTDGVHRHSDYWLVYLRGTRLKVRSTFVETPARVAALERFLSEVVDAFTTPVIPEPVRNERPLPEQTDAATTYGLLEGRWSWEGGEEECKSGVHTLTLSSDRRTLDLRYPARVDSAGNVEQVRYRVVEAGPQILPWAPHAIRLEMEAEDRRTDAGVLVVWDLIFLSRDRYHWHRTDWDVGGMTGAIIRCDAPSGGP